MSRNSRATMNDDAKLLQGMLSQRRDTVPAGPLDVFDASASVVCGRRVKWGASSDPAGGVGAPRVNEPPPSPTLRTTGASPVARTHLRQVALWPAPQSKQQRLAAKHIRAPPLREPWPTTSAAASPGLAPRCGLRGDAVSIFRVAWGTQPAEVYSSPRVSPAPARSHASLAAEPLRTKATSAGEYGARLRPELTSGNAVWAMGQLQSIAQARPARESRALAALAENKRRAALAAAQHHTDMARNEADALNAAVARRRADMAANEARGRPAAPLLSAHLEALYEERLRPKGMPPHLIFAANGAILDAVGAVACAHSHSRPPPRAGKPVGVAELLSTAELLEALAAQLQADADARAYPARVAAARDFADARFGLDDLDDDGVVSKGEIEIALSHYLSAHSCGELQNAEFEALCAEFWIDDRSRLSREDFADFVAVVRYGRPPAEVERVPAPAARPAWLASGARRAKLEALLGKAALAVCVRRRDGPSGVFAPTPKPGQDTQYEVGVALARRLAVTAQAHRDFAEARRPTSS